MLRILLTGKTGQLGRELERSLAPLGELLALDRAALDLADPDAVRRAMRDARPEIVVNAAAYTAVDRAESESDLAMRVNGVAPGILAEEAKRLGALLIHYSTDYVFDGTKDAPYVKSDPVGPVNAYGRSKAAGEAAVRAAAPAHLIFRTSWVYAARGANFVRTMLRLARERAELRIVDDQTGAPTWARSIAGMTAAVLGNGARARENSGVYHYTAAGAVTWHGFARAIFREAEAMLPGFKAPTLIPITTAQYPLPARRPANSRLDCARLTATFGVKPATWEEMLGECFREIEA